MDRRTLLSAAAAGSASLAAPALAQNQIRWRMVTTWPKNAPGVGVNAQRLADKIGEMSAGRLTVRLYAAGELVPAFEALGAVQQGNAELAHAASFFWLGKSDALNYFGSMPFGLMASEIMGWLYFGGGLELWQEAMAEFDIKPFFAGSSGVSAGGWFRKEINSLDDLKGLKFRIAGLGAQVVHRLGAAPVLTPPAEVFPAMAAGTVDAAEFIGPWNDQAFGLYRVAKYYYQPGWHEVGPTAELLVNRRAWEALPADLKAIVDAAATASAMEYHADYAFHNVVSLQPLVAEHGLKLRLFPDDVIAALGRTALEVLAEFGERTPLTRRIHASYMAFLEQANVYSQWFDLPMLQMRAATLGRI
ncbi:MAG TPA: TRAP transporter substrate-binding protein [Geminicoccaceae bacterium]|nr:TRAP transporter substrate-binding protein [Geminicoccaceae bacterium]